MRSMNLPNVLTMLRIFLSAVFVVVLTIGWSYAYTAGLVIFVVASFTDYLDGYIARSRNQITDFGKLMDPLADKILVSAAFVLLVAEQRLAAWFVVLILFREFLVTGVRMLALAKQRVLAADQTGKWKTIAQIVFICLLLIIPGHSEGGILFSGETERGVLFELKWNQLADAAFWRVAELVLGWIVLALTAISAASYLRTFLTEKGL